MIRAFPITSRNPRSLFLLLAALNAAAMADRTVFGALAPVLQTSLRLSDVQLGLVQGSAFAIPYGVALPFAGRLVDAIGGWRTVTLSICVWTLGMVVSALAGPVAILVVGRAMTGVGQAALLPAAMTLILGLAPRPEIGRTIALIVGAGTMGRGVAFALGGLLLGLFGVVLATSSIEPWSAVLLTLAVGNCLLLFALYRWRGDRVAISGREPDAYRAVWHWLAGAPVWIGAVVVAALGTVVIAQGLAAWIAVMLVDRFAITPAFAATVIGATGLVAAPLGAMLGGVIADRTRSIARDQAIVTLGCPVAVCAMVAAHGLPTALAALAATQLLSGAASAIGLVRVQRILPSSASGSANGLFLALTSIVGIGGAPLLVAIVPAAAIGARLLMVVAVAAFLSAAASLAARNPSAGYAA